jgi:Putative DNA-binding domain/EC042_2821-lke REase
MYSAEDIPTLFESKSESASLDFKSKIDVQNASELLEVIKDIVAFSNSGGGAILVGLNDDGSASGQSVTSLLELDPADLTNQIFKYTSIHFHAFEIFSASKDSLTVCAILIQRTSVPLIFTRVGAYEPTQGKTKTVFALGTLYFRHGAKSEPGTPLDLRDFLDREIESIRRAWLDGIVKVVEAPVGAKITIVAPDAPNSQSNIASSEIRLTTNPNAPEYLPISIDAAYPFRQKEAVIEINKRLQGRGGITTHHFFCIRKVHEVEKNPTFCYTQNHASAKYSYAYIDWIVMQFDANSSFFSNTKEAYDTSRRNV